LFGRKNRTSEPLFSNRRAPRRCQENGYVNDRSVIIRAPYDNDGHDIADAGFMAREFRNCGPNPGVIAATAAPRTYSR
jgi:hypothetical protein